MKVEIEIPDYHITQAIESARIGYWAREVFRTPGAFQMSLVEDDTDKEFTLVGVDGRVNHWRQALVEMAGGSPKLFGRMLDAFQIDADVGDALVQYACFGKLKYG